MKPSVLFDNMYTVKAHRRHQTGGYLFNDGQKPPRVEESTKPICWNFFTTLEKKKLVEEGKLYSNLHSTVSSLLRNQIPRDSISMCNHSRAFRRGKLLGFGLNASEIIP